MLAIGAAFLFALGIQFTRKGLRHIDSRTGTLVSIGTATLLYWAVSPWLLERHYWMSPAIALFAAIGLFRPFLSSNLSMAGTRYLGATISSTLASASPVFGVALGVLLLGEYLGLEVALGTAAIVTWRGSAFLAGRRLAGLALVGAHAANRRRVLAKRRAGLCQAGHGKPAEPVLRRSGGVQRVFFWSPSPTIAGAAPPLHTAFNRGCGWLVLTGASYGLAILFLNSALDCGRLSVVAPIVALRTVVHAASGRFPVSRTGGHRPCGARLCCWSYPAWCSSAWTADCRCPARGANPGPRC